MTNLEVELLEILTNVGENLSEATCANIMARGRDEVIPALIALMDRMKDENPEYRDYMEYLNYLEYIDNPGAPEVPNHAANILAKLKAVEAIEPMLDLLSHTEYLDLFSDTFVNALKSFGPSALEPALIAYFEADDENRGYIAEILSDIQVRDPRILSILVNILQEDPVFGADLLAEYGDPTALPELSHRLDSCKPHENYQINEIACVIDELGGTLTKVQQSLRDRAWRN